MGTFDSHSRYSANSLNTANYLPRNGPPLQLMQLPKVLLVNNLDHHPRGRELWSENRTTQVCGCLIKFRFIYA
jgi:hypothetical protein